MMLLGRFHPLRSKHQNILLFLYKSTAGSRKCHQISHFTDMLSVLIWMESGLVLVVVYQSMPKMKNHGPHCIMLAGKTGEWTINYRVFG